MPIVSRRKNPYCVGEVVTMAQFNGSGEGILWRVIKVDGTWIRIEPMLTATGPSVLNPKRVSCWDVKPADIAVLGAMYAELANIINDLVRLRSQDEPVAVPEPECTCPDYWFPPDRREKLRKLPHNYMGVLAHHDTCKKWHS